jgi:hypothetical protein
MQSFAKLPLGILIKTDKNSSNKFGKFSFANRTYELFVLY